MPEVLQYVAALMCPCTLSAFQNAITTSMHVHLCTLNLLHSLGPGSNGRGSGGAGNAACALAQLQQLHSLGCVYPTLTLTLAVCGQATEAALGPELTARALARLQQASDLVARDGGGRQGRLAYHLAALMAREHLIANDAAAAQRLLDCVAGAETGSANLCAPTPTALQVFHIPLKLSHYWRWRLIANHAATNRRLLNSFSLVSSIGFLDSLAVADADCCIQSSSLTQTNWPHEFGCEMI